MMLLLSCSKISLSGWRRHPLYFRDKLLKDVKGNTVVFPPASLLLVYALRFIHRSASSAASDCPSIPSCALHASGGLSVLFAPRRHFLIIALRRSIVLCLLFLILQHRQRLLYIGPLNGVCKHESLILLCSSRYYCPFPRFSSDTMDRVSS